MSSKIRKEVTLDEEIVAQLQIQADLQGRKLKNYMEFILKQKAGDFEASDEYKAMIDEFLTRKKAGKVKFHSWEDVKAKLYKK